MKAPSSLGFVLAFVVPLLAMLVLTHLSHPPITRPPVLGLAIVKHILEAHKSVVYVQSLPTEGTTISFTLKK